MLYLLFLNIVICRFRLGVDSLALGVVGEWLGSGATASRNNAIVLAQAKDQDGEPDQMLPVERLPPHRQRHHPDHERSVNVFTYFIVIYGV